MIKSDDETLVVTMTLKTSNVSTGDIIDELVDSFFEAEVEMERKICRDVVCTSHRDEEGKRNLSDLTFHTVMQNSSHKGVTCFML